MISRLIKWECPRCHAVESEEVPFPRHPIKEPNIVETIPLHCERCTALNLDLQLTDDERRAAQQRKMREVEKPAKRKLVNRIFTTAPDY